VALVVVSGLIEAALELDAAALLDDVSCLMRCRVQIRRGAKRNGVTERVRGRTELMHRCRSSRAVVGLHARHIMMAEACLDPVEMRQRSSGPGDAAAGDLGDVGATEHRIVGALRGPALHGGTPDRVAPDDRVAARSRHALRSALVLDAGSRPRAKEREDRGSGSDLTRS
jgi:hypothetical protein